MFAYPGSYCLKVYRNQVKIPHTTQIAPSGNCHIKRCANLDFIDPCRTGYLVVQVLDIAHLTGQKVKQIIRVCIRPAIQLDLFYQLIRNMVHFLFCRNNMEHIDYEHNQYYCYQNINVTVNVRGVTSL